MITEYGKKKPGRIKVDCKICGFSKWLTLYEKNKNKTGNFYCGKECLRLGFSKSFSGKNNPQFGIKKTDEEKVKMSGKNHWNYGNNKHKNKTCQYCGEKYHNKNTKHCSKKCTSLARRDRVTKPCAWCGKLTTRTKCYVAMSRNFFCSYSCNSSYNAKHNNNSPVGKSGQDHPYYGKRGEGTANWRGGLSFEPYGLEFNNDLKDFIRKRDGYCCQFCGIAQSDYKLHIHHIDYNKQNNNKQNLISLCRKCHVSTNGNREIWTKFFKKISNNRKGATTIPDREVHYKSMVVEAPSIPLG